MHIYRPIKTNILSQGFGDNKACVYLNNWTVVPKYGGTCPGGSVPFYQALGLKGHNGYDLACVYGEDVYFNVIADTKWRTTEEVDSAGGIVLNVFNDSPVEVPEPLGAQARADWEKNGGKSYFRFIYVHAKKNIPRPDPTVTPGAHIQAANSSGASSGNHVHFGMKHVDRAGNTLDKNNGYNGYIDPAPFYKSEFILDAQVEQSFLEAQTGELARLHEQLKMARLDQQFNLKEAIQRILLSIHAFFNR